MKIGFLFAVLFATSVSFAQERSWTAVEVPEAQCGDGSPYRFFVSQGDPKKLSFAFQGGGACWGAESCYGWLQTANLKGQKTVDEAGGIFSKVPTRSPLYDSTMVYFPYCTGDVFAGEHIAVYDGKVTHHQGAGNIHKAFDLILHQKSELVASVEQLFLYGYSAGAIGALVHIREIDRLFGQGVAIKRAVFDAPGLHWGDSFWHKFTPDLNKDYQRTLSAAGSNWNYSSGLIAEIIPATCHELGDWNIGVAQTTRDRIMSLVFGDTTPMDHEARVLGPGGLLDLTGDPTDNCMSFTPVASTHSMLTKDKGGLPSAGGVFPMQFAGKIFAGERFANLK